MTDDTESSGQGYPRQLGLNDDSTEFNQKAFQIWQTLARVRTVVVVKVTKVTVDNDGLAPVGTVDVTPLVKQMDGAGNTFPHGTVFSLPYVRMQGGKNAVICDPEVGDVGVALICDRDISSVKNAKAEAPPGSRRKFSLSDGIYQGGTLNGTPEQYVRFKTDGMEIVDKNGNSYATSSTGIVATPKAGAEFKIVGLLRVTENSVFEKDIFAVRAVLSANLIAASAAITTLITAANITISGTITAAFGAFSSSITSVIGSFSGALAALSATIANLMQAGTVTSLGNVQAGTVTSTGNMQAGTVTSLGDIHANNSVTAGSLVTAAVDVVAAGTINLINHKHPVTVLSTPSTVTSGPPS